MGYEISCVANTYTQHEKTKPVQLRLPESLIVEAKKLADDDGRSLSNLVMMLLKRAVNESKGK